MIKLPTPQFQFVGNKAKGRISKRVFQENKPRQISEKRTFRTNWYVRVRISWYEMFVFRKFGVLCFLETLVLRFALFPYYRRVSIKISLLQYRSRTSNDMSYSRLIEAMIWVIQGCTLVRNWIRGAVVCRCFSK